MTHSDGTQPDPRQPTDPAPLPGDTSLSMSFSELVFSDVAALRGSRPGWLRVLWGMIFEPGILASLLLRAQQCLHRTGNPVLGLIARALRSVGHLLVGADFGHGMVVGPGLRLAHPAGVTMGFGARVGNNVSFAGGVTLAARYYEEAGDEQQFPVIEDGALIGAHAVIVGGVTVGHDALVGANSVVLKDVEPNTIVLGVPAKRIGVREPGDPA